MAKEISDVRLDKRICMKCNANNPKKAKQCRKCGSTHLRAKSKKAKK